MSFCKIKFKIENLIKIFYDFLENDCKISNPSYSYIEEKDGVRVQSIKLRNLNSNDRFKIFTSLYGEKGVTVSSLFPSQLKNDSSILLLDRIFSEFFVLIKMVKDFKITEKSLIIEKLKYWLKDFLSIESTITPYILYPYIHMSKIHYFRQSNRQFRKDNKFTLTFKINRLEIIRLKNK